MITHDDTAMFSVKNRDDASENALVLITDAEIVNSEKGKLARVITDVHVVGEESHDKLCSSQYDALQKLDMEVPSTDAPKKTSCLLVACCMFFLAVVAIILSVSLARSQRKVHNLSDRLVGLSQSEPVVTSSLESYPASLRPTEFPTALPTDRISELPTAPWTDPPSPAVLPSLFYEVSAGTCETHGYRSIYEEETCTAALAASGHTDTWGAFPLLDHALDVLADYDATVVDGCSLGHGAAVSVRSAGSCRARPLRQILQDVTSILSSFFSSAADDDLFGDDGFFGDDNPLGEAGTCECSVHRPCFCQ